MSLADIVAKVNVREKLALFHDHWSPKIVGELNGQHIKLVKFQGEFVWHKHDHEDELFLVLKGRFRMEFRDRAIELEEGEFLIVPQGVEHRPVAPWARVALAGGIVVDHFRRSSRTSRD